MRVCCSRVAFEVRSFAWLSQGRRNQRRHRKATLQKDNSRNPSDHWRLEPLLNLLGLRAVASHFVQAGENPLSPFLAPHINRDRSDGFGQFDPPPRKISFSSDPNFTWFTLGKRIPHQAQTKSDNRSLPVDHKIRRRCLASKIGSNRSEVISFANDMRWAWGWRFSRLIKHRR